MQHQMKLATIPFEKIRDGRKNHKSRLYDEKRQMIKVGDEILISEASDPTQAVNTKVTDLLRYPFFRELFEDNDPKLFGDTSADALLAEIKQFYSDEDEAKYGVVGIRLQKSN